jgi:hypothetical protein
MQNVQHCARRFKYDSPLRFLNRVLYNFLILSTPHLLIRSSYNNRSIGIGTMARARNASSEFPYPSPRCWYILGPVRGITVAITERNTSFADMPEAAMC